MIDIKFLRENPDAVKENIKKKFQDYKLPIIDPSVPIGKDDSQNVEIEKFGDPFVPDFEIPYHTEIMEKFNGIDLDSARKVAGNGFYYLMGDIARLHSAVIAYARDFMINRGFTYCVPPFMIRSNVVTGVMSFAEMDSMMYKIEGEDLYLIGTSEHSMIGKFISVMHRLAALKSELQARMARNTLHILLTTRLLHLRECSLRSLRTTLTKMAQSGFLRLFVLTWAVWKLSSNQHTVFSQKSANYSKYLNKIIKLY